MGFSDTNWVGFGLNWVRFHFLKKSKFVKSSMFTRRFAFFELGSFSRFCVLTIVTLDPIFLTTDGHKHRGGVMRANRTARFAPARGDDNNNCIFITCDFNRVGRKENGTIPF